MAPFYYNRLNYVQNRRLRAMASESKTDSNSGNSSKVIDFQITGFGEFDGVKQNPTEMLMGVLPKLLKDQQQSALPEDLHFSGFTVLEVSGEAATASFKQLCHTAPNACKRVWVRALASVCHC